jgi:DNA replication protein DnaC
LYTVVDLVNRLESEARASRQGRLAEYLTRMDFIILDELGYLPFAQTGGQLLFHPSRARVDFIRFTMRVRSPTRRGLGYQP